MAIVERRIEYRVRQMEERDIPQALDIDREAFPTQWPRPDYASYKRELHNHLARYFVAYKEGEVLSKPEPLKPLEGKKIWYKIVQFLNNGQKKGTVIPTRDCIMGMAGFWLMVGEAHIITIATSENYKRCGIGERLLIEIIEGSAREKAKTVTLEVRVSNTRAQSLYEKYGFDKEGIRRNYYLDNNEDAFIMTIGDITSASFQEHFKQLKSDYLRKWGFSEIN